MHACKLNTSAETNGSFNSISWSLNERIFNCLISLVLKYKLEAATKPTLNKRYSHKNSSKQ